MQREDKLHSEMVDKGFLAEQGILERLGQQEERVWKEDCFLNMKCRLRESTRNCRKKIK